jgi:hypothetical protein
MAASFLSESLELKLSQIGPYYTQRPTVGLPENCLEGEKPLDLSGWAMAHPTNAAQPYCEVWRNAVRGRETTTSNALVIGGDALCSVAACCRFFGGCGLAPACWRFRFRAANSGILGRQQPGNKCGRSKLRLWRIATVQSGSKL